MKKEALRPTVWRTCRTLANDRRLALLRWLLTVERASVSEAAAHFRWATARASEELRQLQSRGLIRSERAGRQVYYSAIPNPAVDYAAELHSALKAAFEAGASPKSLYATLTGFTHPRRLAILAALSKDAPVAGVELRRQCRMSRMALHRHLRKLAARGVAVRRAKGWALSPPRNRLDRALRECAAREASGA